MAILCFYEFSWTGIFIQKTNILLFIMIIVKNEFAKQKESNNYLTEHLLEKGELETKDQEEENLEWSMDDVITTIGLGPWTIFVFLAPTLCFMGLAINMVAVEYIAPHLEFTCDDSNLVEGMSRLNETECYVTNNNKLNMTQNEQWKEECKHFVYDTSNYYSTITEDYNLVCSNKWIIEAIQIVYAAGNIPGSIVGGLLADRYGRQPTVFIASVGLTTATVLMTIVHDIVIVLFSRFFIGFFTYLMVSPAFTIGMEACPIKYRSTYGVIIAFPYAIMFIINSGISYLTRSWKPSQLYGSLPTFLLVLLSSPLLLDESPRWLVLNGKIREAHRIIIKAAKNNKTLHKLPTKLIKKLENIHDDQVNAINKTSSGSIESKFISLISSKHMRILTAVIFAVSFFQSTLYINIPLQADGFKSPFIFMSLLGISEIPAYTITAPIIQRIGRKPFIIFALFMTGLLQSLLVIMIVFDYDHKGITGMIVSAVSYSFVCAIYQCNILYFSELFPTSIRAVGCSIGFFASNMGFILPPVLNLFLPTGKPWIPLMIYISFCYFCGGLVFALPETNKKPLMQTIQDYIKYHHGDEKSRRDDYK